ncbi:MAG: hypothetical protein ACI4OB_06990 [Christensenellales bacterium]
MSFKDMVESDIKGIFLNVDEFGEMRTVTIDNVEYTIPIVLSGNKTEDRVNDNDDHAQGIYPKRLIAHIALSDLPVVPKQGRFIGIDDGTALGEAYYQQYRIVKSDIEMGMIILELEAYDE